MASQLEMLWEQERGLWVPGDTPSFASIYTDMEAAGIATADWVKLAQSGLSRWIDMELFSRYAPGANQTPRTTGGATAGQPLLTAQAVMPWIIGGLVVAGLLWFATKK